MSLANFGAQWGRNEVTCGGHTAPSCAECPQGHGAAWCSGDCVWFDAACVLASSHSEFAVAESAAESASSESDAKVQVFQTVDV